MADEHNEAQTQEQGESVSNQDQAQQVDDVEKLKADIEALKRKNQELLGETKTERQKRREYEERQAQLERERMEQEGQHQELSQRYKAESERYKSELEALNRSIANEKVGNMASKLAHDCASDSHTAQLLERFIRDELDYIDGQVVAANHASVDELVKSMEQSGMYASLWKGSKATGGGATGAGGGAVTKSFNEMDGAELSALRRENPAEYDRLKANR